VLRSNTTGNNNTANGSGALLSNTTGFSNTANGRDALRSNTTGSNSTANGRDALRSNTTGGSNTASGLNALFSNTAGGNNTANGVGALLSNTTGGSNTANGVGALLFNITGNFNTANGVDALRFSTGSSNTAIGTSALNSNTTGSQNTAIGDLSFVSGTAFSNSTAIGYNAQVTASNMIRLGNASVTSINGAVAFTVVSDGRFKKEIKEEVPGLPFIMKLRPVTYHFDMNRMAQFMNTPDSLRLKSSEEAKEKILQTGFIAQEVELAANETQYDFSGIDKPTNDQSYYGLRYAEFTVPLVKAVQEQQVMIEKLKAEIAHLKTQHQSVTGKLETENQLLKSDHDNRLKKIEEMLNVKAQK